MTMLKDVEKSGVGLKGEKPREDIDPVERLARSRLFKEYQKSFQRACGLPLLMRSLRKHDRALGEQSGSNQFCAILADSDAGCATCHELQRTLAARSQAEPTTLRCFAGLTDSAVPVMKNGEPIAHLFTGQVLLHNASADEFSRTSNRLIEMGANLDFERLEEAYFQTQVLDREQYHALLTLLETFAQHLSMVLEDWDAVEVDAASPAVREAARYIKEHQDERLSLEDVARQVNTSSQYFCRLFKKEIGMNFTEYIGRLRVERAKSLLSNPHRRVSEVAYAAGFQSLSQFNRCFSKYAGCSPTAWRKRPAD